MKFKSDKQRKAVMSKMQERNGSSSASPSTINSIRENQKSTQPQKVSPIMETKDVAQPFVLRDSNGNILDTEKSQGNAERLKMIREKNGATGLTITKRDKVTKPQALRDNSEVLFNWKFASNSDNRVIRGNIDKQAIPTDDNPKRNDQHFVWVREGKDRGLYAIDKTDIQRVKY